MPELKTVNGTGISGYAFGAMQFGGRADAAASRSMYDAARDAGITHFDTAYVYTEGQSERLLGLFVAAERDAVFVATKVAYNRPATAETIRDSLAQSLDRLGCDYVDLLYLHRWDGATPLDVQFAALAGEVEAGRARHLGVSNFAAWQVVKAQAVAARHGVRIDAIQPMLNLVKRQAAVEILPMASSEDIAAFPYSPLGGGLLSGKYARGEDGRLSRDTRYAARYGQPWMHEAARGLVEIAAREGVDPATLAVAWCAAQPGVTAPILSAASMAQLAPSLAAIRYKMPPALLDKISALSPTPPPATDRLEEQV